MVARAEAHASLWSRLGWHPAEGFPPAPRPGMRVVVGMSGGVDSSVAAALLVRLGYEVTGVMLKLWTEPGREAENRCCTLEAEHLARAVARRLGIPFHVLDVRDVFYREVVQYFFEEYLAARTPNPCVVCNRTIRWGVLLDYARARLGAAYFATGHYARVRLGPAGHAVLGRGLDRAKDQSYVLAWLTREQLKATLLPLGDLTKARVRQLARLWRLPVAHRADSQDLCFLAGEDYRAFLRRHRPEAVQPGPVLDPAGRVVGQHQGLAFYTLGQRRGLGLRLGRPVYVVDKDPARNALIVGPREARLRSSLVVARAQWHVPEAREAPFRAEVKIRYRAAPAPAWVEPLPEGGFRARFDQPVADITPGQLAVAYVDGWVVAAGFITRAEGR